MPRRKKEHGRPPKPYPPRIDAPPEEIARRVLSAKRPWALWGEAEAGDIPLRRLRPAGELPRYALLRWTPKVGQVAKRESRS